MFRNAFNVFLVSLAVVLSARANTVSVAELGVGANETVWINSSGLGNNQHVYAGVVKLSVDGVAMDGFCIDPWHWSSQTASPYSFEDLSLAPKSANNAGPNPMGELTATKIEQLWAEYYSSGISKVTAAALQLSIWCLVDAAVSNGSYSLVGIDADSALVKAKMAEMNSFLASNPTAKRANLVAITGRSQDYVIQSVPDAYSSLVLLGFGLGGLALLRRRSARR